MQYSESRSRGGRKCLSLESLSILASAVTMKIRGKGLTQNLVEITLDLPKLSTETGIRRTTSVIQLTLPQGYICHFLEKKTY